MVRKYRILSILLVLFTLLLMACGGTDTSTNTKQSTASASPVTLNVFAAASLTESFKDIATQYKQAHPNVTITYNFNGSQLLEQQIANGASADIFASADQTNMKKASDASLVTTSKVFARNKLAVIIPSSNPGKIQVLKDLAQKGKKIVVAAPSVPVGKYMLQVLDKMGKSADYGSGYENAVKGNFVSQEENVKSVVQKVQTGEADAGFVYLTDITQAVSSKVTLIDIPDTFNVIAEYPIAVTKDSKYAQDAQAFIDFVLSTQGQAILTRYHFISVNS
ncbi:molybdate ABC transporter substrate-binding protein [Ktedonobacter racemifer]|uniref:Molybdenum ABC transporter, periplasmic molybdate-binding protein n=1 Tax=Ktedonobacter racemifer DSM 44963 TaxID=485913 RepID=D6TPZ7_KTERA|nr:molybdate ABC transporter substrate-binding protein [Ktedonobacter racemifer]EFH87582.1 molybdenum ABC transporter, periplasmic molybdate-binding protein [Ktedonobacter racemifer DSM 44963]